MGKTHDIAQRSFARTAAGLRIEAAHTSSHLCHPEWRGWGLGSISVSEFMAKANRDPLWQLLSRAGGRREPTSHDWATKSCGIHLADSLV